uniref:ATP-dependent RNA helicase n=1 Tax=Oncorhynchus tshawytscha TaxID=74940 RepID=A0AAZ3Q0Y9_ONCTS
MNPYDRSTAFAIGPDGLCCQSREFKEWHGCRSTKAITKGKYYYEVSCHDQGLCRIGWSTSQAALDLGTDKYGFGFGGTGKKSHNKQFDSYGEEFTMHDTMGCYLDLDNGLLSFSKNGLCLPFPYCVHIPEYSNETFSVLIKVSEVKAASCGPKALIVEPSKELAEQTSTTLTSTVHTSLDLLIIGGVPARDQLAVLEQGVDIVVGTPGRLDDLISTGKLTLSQVRFLVLDECDGLLTAGYTDFIMRIYNQIPQVTSDGKRLQVIVCSATLHSFDVKKLSERIMHFPTWVDLKGEDSVPETVHHVVVPVNPKHDRSWERLDRKNHILTDEVHAKDNTRPGANSSEMWSEAIKILKGEYTIRAIREHNMDQAIIFCRTKIDCDNMEQYFIVQGGGPDKKGHQLSCVCLHGDRKPNERKTNLDRFKVWYHTCANRGRGCHNTRLKEEGGCTIWYNEKELLSDVEEHLKCTITQCEPDIKVPVDDFDGKVTYGKRRAAAGGNYCGHVAALAPTVQELANLEREAQTSFLHLGYLPNQLFKAF